MSIYLMAILLSLKIFSSLNTYSKLCIVQRLQNHGITVGFVAIMTILLLCLELFSLCSIVKTARGVKKSGIAAGRRNTGWKKTAIKSGLIWISNCTSDLIFVAIILIEIFQSRQSMLINNYMLFLILPLLLLLKYATDFFVLNDDIFFSAAGE